MAKVKNAESKLQQGKPTNPKPEAKVTPQPIKQGKPSNPNEVVALKNGLERTFTRTMWDHLPANKEGWKEVLETPKLPAQKQASPDNPAQSYTDSVKEYTELFGEAPGQDLSIEDLNTAIAAKKGEQGNG